jgi:hypothetical protein
VKKHIRVCINTLSFYHKNGGFEMKYQHGLPETTPEFKQDAKDLMACIAHFRERHGIKNAIVCWNHDTASEENEYITFYGDTTYTKENVRDGFWSMDFYKNDKTDVRYIPVEADDELFR